MSALTNTETYPETLANLELPLTVIHLHMFASKDDDRTALQHVAIKPYGEDGKQAVAVAADGHRLTRVIFALQEGAVLTKHVLIPASILKSLKVGKGDVPRLCVTANAGTNQVVISGASGATHADTVCGGITFPAWGQAVPCALAPNVPRAPSIGLNPNYIGDIGDYMRKAKLTGGAVFHLPPDARNPIRIAVPTPEADILCIVMPMRV